MNKKLKSVAFIPARSGSKRVKNKNIKILKNHPLMAYTITSAIQSGVFDDVVCITDSQYYADIAIYYGASVPMLRPKETATDQSPDIEWVKWAFSQIDQDKCKYDIFSILRPTSPLRSIKTIQKAYNKFIETQNFDSLRAVGKCKEHPGKMWIIENDSMKPFVREEINGTPWHSNQYANLPLIYTQDASLEISKVTNIYEKNSISGDFIMPHISEGFDGFDINEELDWDQLEIIVKRNPKLLHDIEKEPFTKEIL